MLRHIDYNKIHDASDIKEPEIPEKIETTQKSTSSPKSGEPEKDEIIQTPIQEPENIETIQIPIPEPEKIETIQKPTPAPRKLSTIEITTQTDPIQIKSVEVNTDIIENLNDEEKKADENEIEEEIIEEEIEIGSEDKNNELFEEKLLEKTKEIDECNKKILELTEELHNLRKDLALKQEEILVNRSSPERKLSEENGSESQIKSMKGVIVNLQQLINEKDELIQSYEGKLKDMKDEHSRAASRMQDEVQKLQAALLDKQQMQLQ